MQLDDLQLKYRKLNTRYTINLILKHEVKRISRVINTQSRPTYH